jgi:hypothetical protein
MMLLVLLAAALASAMDAMFNMSALTAPMMIGVRMEFDRVIVLIIVPLKVGWPLIGDGE